LRRSVKPKLLEIYRANREKVNHRGTRVDEGGSVERVFRE